MIVPAELALTDNGTPWSGRFDDVYHAAAGGLEQAQHVFLGGNQLPQRWQGRARFTILETGFGLGLNFLATWQAWREDPLRCKRLHFVSTELHPFRREDLRTQHAQWPSLASYAAALQAAWPPLTPGIHTLTLDNGAVTLTLVLGDAVALLPELKLQADAIYLDGFAPQKNPQLWAPAFLAKLTPLAAPDATLASWCVAGDVRRALVAEGWQVDRQPGFASKRHMLVAQRTDEASPLKATGIVQHVIVIGAGIAGCSLAEALTRQGIHTTLVEAADGPAQAASGNPAGIVHPMLARDDNAAAQISRTGYFHTLALVSRLQAAGHAINIAATGLLELVEDDALRHELCHRHGFPADYVSDLSQSDASTRMGQRLPSGALFFPEALALRPGSLCEAQLTAAATTGLLTCRWNTHVAQLTHVERKWIARAQDGELIAAADAVVLANAAQAVHLVPEIQLSLREIRGQISQLATTTLPRLPHALCGDGYLTPPLTGQATLGASFVENDPCLDLREHEHAENLQRLKALLPEVALPAINGGRVAMRTTSHDRLPLIGHLPEAEFRPTRTLQSLPRRAGLFALLGLGSRGLCWGPLGAALVTAQLTRAPWPLTASQCRSIDPARFQLQHIRRK